MTARLVVLAALSVAAVPAQIGVPVAGYARDRAASLRPVQGVPGGFFLGKPIATNVISAGFGRTLGFAKLEAEILVVRSGDVVARHDAPSGPALFTFDAAGEPLHIFFPDNSELWTATDSGFRKQKDALPISPDEWYESDELVTSKGLRVRVPEPIESVERLSKNWTLLRCASALYAVQFDPSGYKLVRLPESGE